MNVNDLLAEQDSDFISLNSLISRLTLVGRGGYESWARYLYRLLKNNSDNELRYIEYSMLDGITEPDYYDDYNGAPHLRCLSQAAINGVPDDEIPWGSPPQFVIDDFNRYGFILSELKQFLSTQGIELPDAVPMPKKQAINHASGWREQLGIAVSLTDDEICKALSGVDPFSIYPIGTADSINYSRWKKIISGSISSGELNAEPNLDTSISGGWSIKPIDLYNWCINKNVEYPFSANSTFVQVDLRNDNLDESSHVVDVSILASKDEEISTLKEELESLRALLSKEIESGLPTESTSERRLKQIRVIAVLAQSIFPDPMNIPDGGKTKLESICIGIPGGLFTKASFENAWRESLEQRLVRTEKHDTSSGGGM